MNFSVALERIPVAMGRTKTVLIIGLIGSWLGQVPGVFLFTIFWRHDLVGLFTGMVRLDNASTGVALSLAPINELLPL